MRLLNVDNLKFGEFYGANIPSYCILSHRWGEQELSYKQFRKGIDLTGPGYRKIVDFCAFVQNRKIPSMPHYGSDRVVDYTSVKWVWVDTVCIDKRSSAELTEAINSMYEWYREARECIVHLSDVSEHVSPNLVDVQVRRSSWFTRGWTLQELLAPSTCVFVNKTWDVIGHVCDRERNAQCFHSSVNCNYGPLISRLVSDVTLIPQQELKHSDRFNARFCNTSIARRMSWAARRNTTRVEDEAYCLLGVFGISMPLLYGEGRQAFIRLQEEIVKRTTDQSIFAWSPERRFRFSSTILATSPKQFEHSGHIVKLRNDSANETGYTLSNRGLQIEVKATHMPTESYKAAYRRLARVPAWSVDGDGMPEVILLSLNCHDERSNPSVDERGSGTYYVPHMLAIAEIEGEYRRLIFPEALLAQYARVLASQNSRERFTIKAYDQYAQIRS